jgi:L-ascorbate 6-phosphate lactonase
VRWYCDENGAVEVAGAVGADRLLPTHWDVWRGLTAEPSVLHHHARTFDRPRRVEVVAVGDRVSV